MDELKTPEGFVKAQAQVWVNPLTGAFVIVGTPECEDDRHNCDEMACGQEHVMYRGEGLHLDPTTLFE